MNESDRSIRVAILGGGAGAVSAAFWLTCPKLKNKFKVSLYTQGWRLGGKAASGRNRDHHYRIEEHGLHVLFGFHDNLFQTLNSCYEELGTWSTNPFKTPMDAVSPVREVTMMQRVPDNETGTWETWHFTFPKLPGVPGDKPRFDFDHHIVREIFAWLRGEVQQFVQPPKIPIFHGLVKSLESFLWWLDFVKRRVRPEFWESHSQLRRWGRTKLAKPLCKRLESLRRWFRDTLAPSLVAQPGGFRLCTLFELAVAVSIGYVKDVWPLGENGFDCINNLEFREWLRSHGVAEEYTWTAPVRCLYDLGFAFKGSDSGSADNGALAAGVTLKVLFLLTLGYKDAPLLKTRAAMGEVIFAPLYQVLKERGVDFHFFNRVDNIALSEDGAKIDEIRVKRLVQLSHEYDPIFKLNGIWCWPSEPRWEQIENSDAVRNAPSDCESPEFSLDVGSTKLRSGRDFDIAILAIPPAELSNFGEDLIERNKKIRDMHEHLSWVPTQSVQLWLKEPAAKLGTIQGPVMISHVEPFSSTANWKQLIEGEEWKEKVESLVFFCGTLPPGPDSRAKVENHNDVQKRVEMAFSNWIHENARPFWPRSVKNGRFDRSMIVSDYYRANVAPWEMYVQSFPGSIAYRLPPGDSSIENLYLAGDWTISRINAGSVECAFQSGKDAAKAIIDKFASGVTERTIGSIQAQL